MKLGSTKRFERFAREWAKELELIPYEDGFRMEYPVFPTAVTIEYIYVKFDPFSDKSKTHCYICGEMLSSGPTNKDHVVPRAKGGHSPNNVVITHVKCNNKKSDKLIKIT